MFLWLLACCTSDRFFCRLRFKQLDCSYGPTGYDLAANCECESSDCSLRLLYMGGTGWEHDQNGTRRTITWDSENRIQAIADNGHTMTYKYNDAGQRVIKRGPQGETAYINQFFVIRNREVGSKHV